MDYSDNISRTDAAKILGVCPQTVSNLAKRGLLTEIKFGKQSFYPRSEVEAIAPKTASLSDLERQIQELSDEKSAFLENEKKELDGMKRKYAETMRGYSNLDRYTELLRMVIEGLGLRDKDVAILNGVLDFQTLEEIAEKNGYGPTTVRVSYNKAVRRLRNTIAHAEEKMDALREENQLLENKLRNAEDQLQKLMTYDQFREYKGLANLGLFHMRPLYDFPFTVRAYNSMKSMGLETVGDLLKLTEDDLRLNKRMGRKTLMEIEVFLKKHGLSLAKKD